MRVPFVSSKVIMLALHWAENTSVMDETTERGRSRCLAAKSGNNGELVPGRMSEPPDVNITLRYISYTEVENILSR